MSNKLTPSAEMRDAVIHIAMNTINEKMAVFEENNQCRPRDRNFLMLRQGWIYEACRFNYDSGKVGHNDLVRQTLQDMGYITVDDEKTNEPDIQTINTVTG